MKTIAKLACAGRSRLSAARAAGVALGVALTVFAGDAPATDSLTRTVQRESPWGVAASAALSYAPALWLPAMVDAGVSTVRGFHATPTDEGLAPLTDAGIAVTGILQWSSGSVLSLPANDLSGWRAYVTEQITRYKGRIRYWEVWNEPPNFTDDRSPVSYGRVVATAYEAAKAVDATVQIGLAAKSNHVAWLAESIAAGAFDKFDFVTLHPYENAGLLTQGWEGQFMSIAPRVRTMLLDKNPAKAAVPVWFTEIGIPVASAGSVGVTPAVQADGLVKIYAMSLAQQVSRIYWFDPRDSEGLNMGLTAADGSKRPAYFALQTLRATLGRQPAFVGWTQPDDAYHGFVFEAAHGAVLCAWTPPGQQVALDLASDVELIDPPSGTRRTTRSPTLTDSPVLLVAPANSSQAVQWLRDAAANRGKAFRWHGDHSGVASVSLTAGAAPDGVYIVDPPPTTVVDGIAEFSFEGRGGPSFTVDPSFLSYAGTPIHITVVIRSHGTGAAGFNLKYEADVPLAASDGNGLLASAEGWQPIVDTAFHQKTWTIQNPRFIGLYGYNFSFDSDGPQQAHFSIHKVVVTKQ